jgi:hypothetical protein
MIAPRLTLLAATALVLAAADVGAGRLRTVLTEWRQQPAVDEASGLARDFRVRHPVYSHDLAPGFEGAAMWGPIRYRMSTNSFGFRDAAPRAVAARGAAPRLLLIGDSFLEGPGVDYESTVPALVAAQYAGRGLEVLNAGVLSYSPVIYWKKIAYLLERGLQFDAAAVFIDISDIQDEAAWYRLDGSGHVVEAAEPPFDFLHAWMRGSLTFRGLVKASQLIYPHAPIAGCRVPDFSDYGCRAGWTTSPLAMDRYGRAGLRLASERMSALAALLRRHGIPLVVVVYPWPQQLWWNDRASQQIRHWREWSRRDGAEFVELFTPFFDEVDTRGTRQAVDRYFIPGDIHWSAEGHELVAAGFSRGASGLLERLIARPVP